MAQCYSNHNLRWLITLVCSITHICWLYNTFFKTIRKKRLVNPKEEMTTFEWPCTANFEVIRHLVLSYNEGKTPVPLENEKLHNRRIKLKTLNLVYGKAYWHMNSVKQSSHGEVCWFLEIRAILFDFARKYQKQKESYPSCLHFCHCIAVRTIRLCAHQRFLFYCKVKWICISFNDKKG